MPKDRWYKGLQHCVLISPIDNNKQVMAKFDDGTKRKVLAWLCWREPKNGHRKMSRAQFYAKAKRYDKCAERKDCDKCPKLKLCVQRWDLSAGHYRPFADIPQDMTKEYSEPSYDTSYISSVLRRAGVKDV